MAAKIGSAHGVEATRLRLNAIDPGKAAYNKLLGEPGKNYGDGAGTVEGTMMKLVEGHNEAIDRMAVLEAAVDQLPFLRAPGAI